MEIWSLQTQVIVLLCLSLCSFFSVSLSVLSLYACMCASMFYPCLISAQQILLNVMPDGSLSTLKEINERCESRLLTLTWKWSRVAQDLSLYCGSFLWTPQWPRQDGSFVFQEEEHALSLTLRNTDDPLFYDCTFSSHFFKCDFLTICTTKLMWLLCNEEGRLSLLLVLSLQTPIVLLIFYLFLVIVMSTQPRDLSQSLAIFAVCLTSKGQEP